MYPGKNYKNFSQVVLPKAVHFIVLEFCSPLIIYTTLGTTNSFVICHLLRYSNEICFGLSLMFLYCFSNPLKQTVIKDNFSIYPYSTSVSLMGQITFVSFCL
jgi:hypothetical protein